MELPHQNTLHGYIGFTNPGSGFNIDVMDRLKHNIKFSSLKPHERNVSLLFDEMHIKSGLVFSKSSGKLVGFTELGDINQELEEFSTRIENKTERDLTTTVLTFMVRGLCKYFNYPIGFFGSHNGFGSEQLYPLVWEAVRACELQGIDFS